VDNKWKNVDQEIIRVPRWKKDKFVFPPLKIHKKRVSLLFKMIKLDSVHYYSWRQKELAIVSRKINQVGVKSGLIHGI